MGVAVDLDRRIPLSAVMQNGEPPLREIFSQPTAAPPTHHSVTSPMGVLDRVPPRGFVEFFVSNPSYTRVPFSLVIQILALRKERFWCEEYPIIILRMVFLVLYISSNTVFPKYSNRSSHQANFIIKILASGEFLCDHLENPNRE